MKGGGGLLWFLDGLTMCREERGIGDGFGKILEVFELGPPAAFAGSFDLLLHLQFPAPSQASSYVIDALCRLLKGSGQIYNQTRIPTGALYTMATAEREGQLPAW